MTLSSVSPDTVSLQQGLVPQGHLPVRCGSQPLGHAEEPHEPPEEGPQARSSPLGQIQPFSDQPVFVLIFSMCADCPESRLLEN